VHRLLFLLIGVLCESSAHAQPAPIPQAYAPSVVYDTPPASLALPQGFAIDEVRAAIGNVVRWRDQERARMGRYAARQRGERLAPQNAMPDIGGYFAIFGADGLAGVVEGRWSYPASEVGQPASARGAYIAPRRVCGGLVTHSDFALADATFLGATWRADFETLDAQLQALAPMPEGAELRSGVPFTPDSLLDFSRFYPGRALDQEIEGQATLGCFVKPDHRLQCGVVSEAPAGFGFGHAALRIFARAHVEPQARNGEPSAGRCTLFFVPFVIQ
jgi:hypothetical protein